MDDDTLHFYHEITSFSCSLQDCEGGIVLAEVTRLPHVVSVGSASHAQCPPHEEMTDEM